MRVYDTVQGSMGCASNTTALKGNDALGLLNGENSHRSPYALLQANTVQMLAPAFRGNKEEIANWTIACIVPIQLLKMLVFLDTLPGDTSVYLFGILYPHPGGTITG